MLINSRSIYIERSARFLCMSSSTKLSSFIFPSIIQAVFFSVVVDCCCAMEKNDENWKSTFSGTSKKTQLYPMFVFLCYLLRHNWLPFYSMDFGYVSFLLLTEYRFLLILSEIIIESKLFAVRIIPTWLWAYFIQSNFAHISAIFFLLWCSFFFPWCQWNIDYIWTFQLSFEMKLEPKEKRFFSAIETIKPSLPAGGGGGIDIKWGPPQQNSRIKKTFLLNK